MVAMIRLSVTILAASAAVVSGAEPQKDGTQWSGKRHDDIWMCIAYHPSHLLLH